ncbi:hypothetical protein GCM10025857_24590 [Alicyclobacillus contaminans]|nr:hypothetical protein GCM10025857_24590 [Alicyclobacillus contaminans]
MSYANQLDTLLTETRRFAPPESFAAQANYNDPGIYERALAHPEAYWAEEAKHLTWFKPFDQVLEWNPPHAKWFIGGKLNAAYNAVDRHRLSARKNKAAIIWEGSRATARCSRTTCWGARWIKRPTCCGASA